jgi:DNA-binding NtrC family response regulator
LAAHFALRAAKRLGTVPLVPSPEDISLLVAYPWPGNVRELAAVIERAAILGDGKRLDVSQALGGVGRPPDKENVSLYTKGPSPFPAAASAVRQQPLPDGQFATLDTAMARHIEAALIHTRGRIEGPYGAAALLQINPHTLRARMRKLGLDWRRFRGSGLRT